MPADPASSSTTRAAPIALWRVAEAFLHTLHGLFGAPEDVAADHTLLRKAHAQLAQWLRCAEAMLRRLLLLEAQAYGPPASSRQTATAGKMPAVRARKLCSFDADKPEAWRVSFRCFMERRRPRRHLSPPEHTKPAGTPALHKFYSAWPLAERYEALIRVFNDPAPYARRLSRRLHATPHRIVEALRAPPEAVHRVERFDEMGTYAESGWRAPRFSSA